MHSEITNTIIATEEKAQYDASAKRLLGQKIILAHILVKAVEEFKGMDPKDAVSYIEGAPRISTVPVEPGLTKMDLSRVTSFNTEDNEVNEGLVRFDILFYVRTKDGLSQFIINVEAQKSEPTEYNILNRAIFYISRLVSSQKEKDFTNSNYNAIKRVYSIWVCMGTKVNSMCHMHLTKDDILGNYNWKGDINLLNIVMIGLTQELPEQDERYELHRLLCALLSQELTVTEKLNLINVEYDIPINNSIKGEVNTMCNLSEGIVEKGRAEGRAEGIISFAEQLGLPKDNIIAGLISNLSISEEQALDYYNKYATKH